jgi:uncharacterized protein YbjT (DUF2867 family)
MAIRKVLVLGGYGLIGAYVVSRLVAAGFEVAGAGRSVAAARRRFAGVPWIEAELGRTTVDEWEAKLAGFDAVVNCAGALQGSPRDDLRAVHVSGLADLIEACEVAGAKRFVHVSAAGLGPERATAFNATKLRSEALLKGSSLDWTILRPGLVIAPAAHGGSSLLRGLAGLPGVIPAVHADSVAQLVSVDDVAEAVVRCLDGKAVRRTVDVAHAEPVRLGELLRSLRAWLGLPPAPLVPLPGWTAVLPAAVSDALAWLGWRSPMRTTTLEQLRMGVRADGEAAERELGLKPKALAEMLAGWPSGVQERWFARIYFVKPLAVATLAAFWLVSGAIGLTLGFDGALDLLTGAGLGDDAALLAVNAGGVTDIALGLALLVRRTARPAAIGMVAVSLAYLAGATVLTPFLWIDPLGPLVKVLPATVLALVVLAILDER